MITEYVWIVDDFKKSIEGEFKAIARDRLLSLNAKQRRNLRRAYLRGDDMSKIDGYFNPAGTPIQDMIKASLQDALEKDKSKRSL